MAGKKRGEAQLQAIITNQSLWDEMMLNKGLTVIDVYQAWCGPCKAMQTLFRKLKNELNEDEILHFAVAEADNIVTLQPFRDKCEPVFLFSLNGKIISKVKGANAPLVNEKVMQLINEEKKIAVGEMNRPQYHEIMLADSDTEDAGEVQDESAEEQYNIAIIKPDAVLSGKVHEIKEKITKAGFVIEAEDKRRLTEDNIRNFYSRIADQPDFEDFVSFMKTAISYILVVSQGNKKLAHFEESESEPGTQPGGPSEDHHEVKDKVTSKEVTKRDSLPEYLERQHISQFCDVEDNAINVDKFIDTFFPDFKKMKSMKLEKILALIRPSLFKENKGKKESVLEIIEKEGFKILMQRQIVLSKEEAQTFCKDYEKEDYFENLIENMTSGPSLVLVLLGDNGLKHWKELLGPKSVEEAREYAPESLCAQFARENLPINQLYGSDSLETAEKEIQYFFPPQSTLALIKPHVSYENRDDILKIIKEAGFEVKHMKEILLTKELADCIYLNIRNKDFYKDVLQILFEGPCLLLVLAKWNAVSEWRRLMGPTDPEEARLLSPDSIRAHFGTSILHNAVHGASSAISAEETIRKLFGELDSENLEEN
ncbi:thioredoxin domain-containing protein 3 [Orycteropus afer afer]|uniref:Thioredoxin domain-containing protein 3 n=1 Tax=Orycteropus afer afer TaxID=1230840 RepID=A0A8B7ALB2_ORYAF|nr:thioredoxin domain-containing protein 3 [Orycteropus afer afer]